MGGQISTATIQGNDFLKSLQDGSQLNSEIMWEEVSSMPQFYPAVLGDSVIEKELDNIVTNIVSHSETTQRAGACAQVLCNMIGSWASNCPTRVPYATLCNYLIILQNLCKKLYDVSEGDFEKLAAHGALPKGGTVCNMVADTMLTFSEKHPLLNMEGMCLNAHVLVISTLTVCCSSPLYSDIDENIYDASPTSVTSMGSPCIQTSEVIDHVCFDAEHTRGTVYKLLSFVTKAEYAAPEQYSSPLGSLTLLLDLAASLVLPSSLAKSLTGGSQRPVYTKQLSAHLGRRSALLLTALLYRRKNDSKLHPTHLLQAFRAETDETEHDFPVPALFDTFCRPGSLQHPEMVLLLYTLLNENNVALEYILNHAEVSRLVFPITELLHSVSGLWEAPASLYVLLSVLLMCSQHRAFNTNIHTSSFPAVCKPKKKKKKNPPQVPWYTERTLRNVSAGSLLILMLVRVIQYNMVMGQDPYVTRQCMSILSNMGGVITNMHEYTAQRLVGLAVFLGKKLTKRQLGDDYDLYAEYLRSTVVVINACLASVHDNIKLVYELLHQRSGFEDMRVLENEALQTALQRIYDSIAFFSKSLDDVSLEAATVENVTEVLRGVADSWSCAQTPAAGDRYAFAEEASPEAFFVPYSWDLV